MYLAHKAPDVIQVVTQAQAGELPLYLKNGYLPSFVTDHSETRMRADESRSTRRLGNFSSKGALSLLLEIR